MHKEVKKKMTFAFNPMVIIHICAIIQTGLLVCFILIPENFTPKEKKKGMVLEFIMSLGSGALVIFGILFVDTALLWLFGNWSMTDWRFQLPSVIIILFLGLEYIIFTLFRRGNLLDILFCGIAVATIVVFLHWWVPLDALMGSKLKKDLPMIIGVLFGVYMLISVIKITIKQKKSRAEEEIKYLWDIRKQLRYVYNRKINILFWLLAVVQSMLMFYGYSIFTLFAS